MFVGEAKVAPFVQACDAAGAYFLCALPSIPSL